MKYKINNKYIVDCESPKQAAKITKVLNHYKSSVNDAHVHYSDLRKFCIENNYYTRGTIDEYNNLLQNCDKWELFEIASDIAQHSNGVWATEVLQKLRQRFKDSVKDSKYLFPRLNNEDRKNLEKYNLRLVKSNGEDSLVEGDLSDLKRYAKEYLGYELHPDYIHDADEIEKYFSPDKKYYVMLDGNWGEIYDTKTQETIWSGRYTKGSAKQLLEDWKRANNINDNCKDSKIIKIEELKKGDKFKDPYNNDEICVIEEIDNGSDGDYKIKNLKNGTSSWVKREKRVLIDNCKDSEIEELSAEEEQAIEDYKKAIANTSDPKLLKIFAHILKEETEHLEELQNEHIEDTCEIKNK